MTLLGLHLLWGRSSFVFLVFLVALAFKVTGSFVFMGRTEVVIAPKGLGHITRRILVEFLIVTEDNDCDVHGTKNSELVRLLE